MRSNAILEEMIARFDEVGKEQLRKDLEEILLRSKLTPMSRKQLPKTYPWLGALREDRVIPVAWWYLAVDGHAKRETPARLTKEVVTKVVTRLHEGGWERNLEATCHWGAPSTKTLDHVLYEAVEGPMFAPGEEERIQARAIQFVDDLDTNSAYRSLLFWRLQHRNLREHIIRALTGPALHDAIQHLRRNFPPPFTPQHLDRLKEEDEGRRGQGALCAIVSVNFATKTIPTLEDLERFLNVIADTE